MTVISLDHGGAKAPVQIDGPEAERLVASLTGEFPQLTPQEVSDRVAEIYETYRYARIRTFVPILVEREARDELRARSRHLGAAFDTRAASQLPLMPLAAGKSHRDMRPSATP